MGVLKKGRVRFEYLGEYFHWWFDNWHLRVCSEDKSFVIACFMGGPSQQPHLEVHGTRFPGIEPDAPSPIRLCVPRFVVDEFSRSSGAFINALIRWSLRKSHRLKYYEHTATS